MQFKVCALCYSLLLLSCHFKGIPGPILLLFGNSGSGKSTAIELLCKEYEIEIVNWNEDMLSSSMKSLQVFSNTSSLSSSSYVSSFYSMESHSKVLFLFILFFHLFLVLIAYLFMIIIGKKFHQHVFAVQIPFTSLPFLVFFVFLNSSSFVSTTIDWF
jgi:energy-coupling factor transporter ATP-binding protein EcfA2